MTITGKRAAPSSEDLLAEFKRRGRRRGFEEMLGPEPALEDAEELRDFLAFLEEQRHQPARYPGDREPGR